MPKRTHPVEQAENLALMNADHFLVTRRLGVGRYDVRRADTLPQAEALSQGDRRSMLYAVNKKGDSHPLWLI